MVFRSNFDVTGSMSDLNPVTISALPSCSQLTTPAQIRNFELLRLAFFILKLRKFEQRHASSRNWIDEREYAFRCSLLQHAIFQQVLGLTSLGARDQALQLLATCHR